MPEEPKYVAQDDSELNVIFIHSKLDDIGLTANQFRIFAHLSRRAHSAGKAWPGIDSMASVCRMHKETVIACLRELEGLGMIFVERSPGKRSVYRLTAPSKWQAVGEGERSEPGNPAVGTGERQRSEPGNVRKSKEGNPKKEAAEAAGEDESSIKSKVTEISLPAELDSDEFIEAWDEWMAYRRERRFKAMTPRFATAQLAMLAGWGQPKAILSIKHSIAQGWQGIFEYNETKKTAGSNVSRNAGTFNAGTAGKFKGVEKLAPTP